jgi:hypothetical protein
MVGMILCLDVFVVKSRALWGGVLLDRVLVHLHACGSSRSMVV